LEFFPHIKGTADLVILPYLTERHRLVCAVAQYFSFLDNRRKAINNKQSDKMDNHSEIKNDEELHITDSQLEEQQPELIGEIVM